MRIEYVVYKCTNDMGRTNSKEIGRFEDVNCAISLHIEKHITDFTWYEIGVEYN